LYSPLALTAFQQRVGEFLLPGWSRLGGWPAVELTAEGRDAGAATFAAVASVEARWRAGSLRKVLEPLVGDGTMAASPLAVAVEPRAERGATTGLCRRRCLTIPWCPIVAATPTDPEPLGGDNRTQ
jgi:hypothetical protein